MGGNRGLSIGFAMTAVGQSRPSQLVLPAGRCRLLPKNDLLPTRNDAKGHKRHSLQTPSSRQLGEQRLGLSQIGRVEPFSEPAVDWSEKITSPISLALV
jgi:hypothetical protein